VLEVDPGNDTVRAIPVPGITVRSDAFSNLGPGSDGLLYSTASAPVFGNKILVVDPDGGTVSMVDTGLTHGPSNWDGLTVGPNGKLYGIPDPGAPGVLVIDTHGRRPLGMSSAASPFFNKY
jgi:hypothetical protein